MVDAKEFLSQIQDLPVEAQRTLIERVVRALEGEPLKQPRQPEDPFLGRLADEPDLADELQWIWISARSPHYPPPAA
jgi:hypothetical protein